MKTSAEIATEALAFTDEERWQDRRAALDAREAQILGQDFFGLAISAPARVPLAERDELPIVLAIRQSGLRAWEVGRDKNVVIAAINLDTRAVTVARVFRDRKDEEYPPREVVPAPDRPTGVSAESVGVGVRTLRARALLDLPWRPARYRFAVLDYDWISNLAEVELAGNAPPARGAARPVRPLPPAPSDGLVTASLPSYLPIAASAASPIALSFGPALDRGSAFAITGSFTTTADGAHVPSAPIEIIEDGAPRNVSAVVPLTIALALLDGGRPWLLELGVAVYGSSPVTPGEPLSAHFALDVAGVLQHALPFGAYRAWAFLEGNVHGPWIAEHR